MTPGQNADPTSTLLKVVLSALTEALRELRKHFTRAQVESTVRLVLDKLDAEMEAQL